MTTSALRSAVFVAFILLGRAAAAQAADAAGNGRPDWLIDPSPYRARIETAPDGASATLTNGLIARRIRLSPNAATTAFDDLVSGASLIRAVKPEAYVTLDGKEFAIGGLSGPGVKNFLTAEAESALTADPNAFRSSGTSAGPVVAPFARIVRSKWTTDSRPWPPQGVGFSIRFSPPPGGPAVSASVDYELYDGLPLLAKT